MAEGTPKMMTSPLSSTPMSFSDAPNKAKAAAKAKKVLEGGAPHAQTTMAYWPRKTEEGEEDDNNKVELRMPGSFDFGDHSGGAAHETRVWVLSIVDRSMLSVCGYCGQGYPMLHIPSI